MKKLVRGLGGLLVMAMAATAWGEPLRLAVMDFTTSAPGELESLGVGLRAMLTTDLAAVPSLALVERARLRDIQDELKLGQSGAVDKATAARIGNLAGASHLITGAVTVVGGKLRIDARLLSVQSGEIAFSEKIEGSEAQFFELEKQLARRIVDGVGVKLGKPERAALARPWTTDYEAFQKFSQGVALGERGQIDAGITSLQAALAKDPHFALAATKLAELRALAPPPKPPESQCRPNPLWSGQCSNEPTPTVPLSPVVFATPDRPVGIVVRSAGSEARCVTPCQLHLPEGRAQLEVLTPVRFQKTLDLTPGPASISVTTRDRTSLIVGSVLAGFTLAMVAATVAIHEAPYDPSTGSSAQQYWPTTLALATGALFPAVYYLLKIGKNDARVTPLMRGR